MSDVEELQFETNDWNDWSNSNDDDENNSVPYDNSRNSNRPAEPNHNPSQNDAGHIKL